jgi:hypothetical protein
MLKRLFSGDKKDPAEAFWGWFQENETRIWKIDQDTEKIYQMVRNAINAYCPGLTFEIGMSIVDGRRQFFISDGGDIRYALKVAELHDAAPNMSHWQIIKHSSAQTTPTAPVADNPTTGSEDTHFQLFNDGEKVGILFMFDNYQESKRDIFARIASDLLKSALGEQGVQNRVGFIDYAGTDSNFYATARPLSELSRAFEEYYRNYRQ